MTGTVLHVLALPSSLPLTNIIFTSKLSVMWQRGEENPRYCIFYCFFYDCLIPEEIHHFILIMIQWILLMQAISLATPWVSSTILGSQGYPFGSLKWWSNTSQIWESCWVLEWSCQSFGFTDVKPWSKCKGPCLGQIPVDFWGTSVEDQVELRERDIVAEHSCICSWSQVVWTIHWLWNRIPHLSKNARDSETLGRIICQYQLRAGSQSLAVIWLCVIIMYPKP